MKDAAGPSFLRSPLFGLLVGVAAGALLGLIVTDQGVGSAFAAAVVGGLCGWLAVLVLSRAKR